MYSELSKVYENGVGPMWSSNCHPLFSSQEICPSQQPLFHFIFIFYFTHGGTKIKLVGNLNAPWLSNRK